MITKRRFLLVVFVIFIFIIYLNRGNNSWNGVIIKDDSSLFQPVYENNYKTISDQFSIGSTDESNKIQSDVDKEKKSTDSVKMVKQKVKNPIKEYPLKFDPRTVMTMEMLNYENKLVEFIKSKHKVSNELIQLVLNIVLDLKSLYN